MHFNDLYFTLTISQHHASLILTKYRGKWPDVIWHKKWHFQEEILAENTEHHYPNLEEALKKITAAPPEQCKGKAVPISVILADPCTVQTIFYFEHIPKDDTATRQLIGWRFSKEFQLDPGNNLYSYQPLTNSDEKQQLYCMAIRKSLIDTVVTQLTEANLPPNVIDVSFSACYSYFYPWLKKEKNIFITLYEDFWGISIIEENGNIRFNDHWWQHNTLPLPEKLQKIVEQITHITKLYNLEHEHHMSQLYMIGPTEEMTQLKKQLPSLHCQYLEKPLEKFTTGNSLSLFEKIAVLR